MSELRFGKMCEIPELKKRAARRHRKTRTCFFLVFFFLILRKEDAHRIACHRQFFLEFMLHPNDNLCIWRILWCHVLCASLSRVHAWVCFGALANDLLLLLLFLLFCVLLLLLCLSNYYRLFLCVSECNAQSFIYSKRPNWIYTFTNECARYQTCGDVELQRDMSLSQNSNIFRGVIYIIIFFVRSSNDSRSTPGSSSFHANRFFFLFRIVYNNLSTHLHIAIRLSLHANAEPKGGKENKYANIVAQNEGEQVRKRAYDVNVYRHINFH